MGFSGAPMIFGTMKSEFHHMQRKTEALHRNSAGQGGKDDPRDSSSPTNIELGMQLAVLSEWIVTCVCQEVQSLRCTKLGIYCMHGGVGGGPVEASGWPVTARLDP
jgi:hypothetical protein